MRAVDKSGQASRYGLFLHPPAFATNASPLGASLRKEKMWKVEYNSKSKRYYLRDTATGKKRIVPRLTSCEIEIERYQQYYDKAHVQAEYLNNAPVYHTRVVNGKKYMYKMCRAQQTLAPDAVPASDMAQ